MTTTHLRHPGLLTQVDTADMYAIGTPWTDQSNWKRYRYVYNAGADTWEIGEPIGVYLTATTFGECSFTAATQLVMTDGTDICTPCAGIALSEVATTEFGWIQVGGICNYMVTDGTLNASIGGVVDDNGVVVTAAAETLAHGIFCVGITADAAALSVNALLFKCVMDHH
jgi:hypothetical protein